MSGTHKFTSSVWIQSGSGPATFQSGISVTGNVSATKFVGDGSGLTGIGTGVFFAGSGSGISASTPSSIDHIIFLDAEAAISPVYRIETTSSGNFKPNNFVFVKLTNKFETLQEGSQSFYDAADRTPGGDEVGEEPFTNDRAPGVHRYIVYATDTGSTGETHAVYTSAFIEGYVNVAPVIIPAPQSDGVVQIGHDKNSLSQIIQFTGSFEPNGSQGDFIRVFSASRSTSDPIASSTTAAYDLTMQHHQLDIADSDNLIATGSVDPANPYLAQRGVYGSGTGNNAALPNSVLAFTASISDYEVTGGGEGGNLNREIFASTIQPREEQFKITMFDNWFVDHSSSLEYSMSIVPPNTASINNIRLEFESGSFTGHAITSYETTVLYDDTITRDNIEGLHDRYTSSLVRVSVMADITEPADYDPDPLHFTTVRIFSGSDPHLRHQAESGKSRRHFQLFRFSGSTATGLFRATASTFLEPGANLLLSNVEGYTPTHSLGFTAFALSPQTFNYGFSGRASDLANTNYITHGNHQHFSAQTGSITSLVINSVPDIEISNVRVEVESGSFLTGVGAFERSASVLYGFTSSLRVAETSSLEGYEKSAEYISASVVRLRLLATVTEPFGPHHTKMISTLETDASSYPHSHVFEFHTGSGAIHTASSAIAYDSHDRLVGHYTSSWINFNLLPGQYTFSASFNSDTNAGRTITAGTYAEVSMSNTPPTEITNIRYETETAGYSEEASTNAMRTVLYGVPRHTLADSSSFVGHDNAVTYASHSVSRFRVLADIREPFGPLHTGSLFQKVWKDGNDTFTSVIHFSTASTDTASSAIAYDAANRLLARYTSSWIGQQLSSSNNAANTWTYTSGSIIHAPHDLSGFTTSSGLSTQLKVNDTARIQLSNRIHEFEEYGHSASSAADTGVTNIIRTVLYGSNRRTLVDSSSIEGHDNTAAYASQSVSRVRMRVQITEPVGPGHGNLRFIPTLVGDRKTLNAFTNSADFESISHGYDSQKRLVANYTESWHGVEITEAPTTKTAQFDDSDTTNVATFASKENGIILGSPTNADIEVFDTVPTQITNIRYQTETFGYSGQPSTDTTRKVLYGVAHTTNTGTGSGDTGESWSSHDSASLYASQSITRFRVLATITEPVGPLHTASKFEKVWTADNESEIRDVIHFSTASGDITASSVIGYDSSNRLVAHYTSSYIGVELASNNFTTGEQWKYTSGSILHEPQNENKFTTSSGESTAITVFDTQPTVFSNFKTETETHGYSGIPTQNTFRKVLYGVAHATVAASSSFTGHINAVTYASQSVSQFRIVARITEPVGPLQHTASRIEKTFKNEIETVDSKTETIIFGTASIGFETSRSFFTPVGEFVTEYTTSFIGKVLEVQQGASAERDWTISTGSVIHAPAGENSANSSSFTATFVKVQNTDATQIDSIVYETETAGYSEEGSTNETRTVLYGVPHHTLINSASFKGHTNADVYAQQAVTRFRVRARITEPVGPLHTGSKFEKVWTDGSADDPFTSVIHFQTASGDLLTQSLQYNSAKQLVVNYTSSWVGQQLSSSINASKTWTYTSGSILHEPTGENAFTTASGDSTQLVVNDTAKVQIEKIFWETETFGYSNEEISNGYRTVLYGNNRVTEVDSGSYESHVSASVYASHSVSRIRFRARVTDPIGPAVNNLETVFNYDVGTANFIINTSSIQNGGNVSFNYINNQLVAHYTSSYIGREFDTITNSQKQHDLTGNFNEQTSGENGLNQLSDITNGSIIVRDTLPTQIDSIAYETETFGYSGVASTNTSRTVLYGDTQVTNVSTQSVDWSSHDSASLYASQSVSQFRVRARIIEPVGPLHTASRFEQIWTAPNLNNDSPLRILSDNLHFSTASINIVSRSFSDSAGRFIVEYTSSFEGRGLSSSIRREDRDELPSGETYIYTSGSILHEPQNENGFVTSSGESTTITVFDTSPTRFDRILLETETFGYSGVGATSGTRKVLYGVPHHTIADTGSVGWTSHPSASLYASQSVTQFRIKARITEPVGPHQTGSILRQQFTSNQGPSEQIANVGAITSPLQSSQFDSGELLNAFDSSGGSGYSARSNEILTVIFNEPQTIERVEVDSDPQLDSSTVNLEVIASPDNGITDESQNGILTSNFTPTRPFNYFELRFNNEGNIDINEIRFFRSTFTQPIIYNNTVFNLNTDSPQIESSRSFYNEESRLVSEFTSSYFGVQLSASIDNSELYQHSLSQIVHNPIDASEIEQTINPTITNLRVFDTAAPKYENFKTETETHGYSNEPVQNTIRTVLYGNNQITEVDSGSYESHVSASVYASHSVSRFRTLARIIEPVGPLEHTASRSEMTFNSAAGKTRTIVFGTGSNNFVKSFFTPLGEFVAEYTTSYEGTALESGTDNTIWTIQNQTATHQAPGENPPQNNASATTVNVRNTEPTQIDSIAYETETHGYSGVASTSTIRKVLYGDNKITNIDSASFTGHIKADVYASHSVSQFRVRARVTEPVGPLHSASRFDQIWSAAIGGGAGATVFVLPVESTWDGNWSNSNVATKYYSSADIVGADKPWDGPNNLDNDGTPSNNTGPIDGLTAAQINNIGESQTDPEPFIFTEGSGGGGDSFVFRTPKFNLANTSNNVLNLYYYAFGNKIGPFTIHIGESSNNITTATALTFNYSTNGTSLNQTGVTSIPDTDGVQSDDTSQWFKIECDLTSSVNAAAVGNLSNDKYIYFKHVPNGSFQGDFSIDNIWIQGTETSTSEETHTNSLIFSTASVGIVSKSFSDTAGRFIVEYTSSYAGINLSGSAAGTTWTYTSASILHEPPGENSFTTASGDSSTMTVFDTENTQIRNMRIETETVGHSNIGVQNRTQADHRLITRSILYGESASFANSSSFHGLDPIFANTSVTRFRVLADIVEPLGPHHTGSLFAYTKDAVLEEPAGADPSHTVEFGEGVSNFIIFSTSSVQTASSAIAYDSQTRLAAAYTSSFFGESLSPSKILSDGFWHIHVDTSNIHHTPIDNSGVNKSSDSSDLYMVVSASKPLTVTNLRTEVEAFPYSSSVGAVSRTEEILYGYNRTLSASDADTVGDIWSGSAAIRFRTLATITEPIGFRHFKTQFTMSNANVGERGFEFHTASLETSSRSARTLNSIGQFVTHYTSAFHDGFTFKQGTFAFSPSAKVGSDTIGLYVEADGIDVTPIGSNAQITIDPTPSTAITNIRIETETVSGSGIGAFTRETTILHGNTVTETDNNENSAYASSLSQQQLTSVRLLADIAEPFGPHHTASIFTISGYGGTHKVRLHTGSANLSASAEQMYNAHGSASVAYTSSFVPIEMVQDIHNLTVAVEHEFEDSKTTTEGTHASITVQGPTNASIFVNPQTGSQFFSSSVDIDKYVTYNRDANLVVDIISGISASAPPITSQSILTFPEHVNILYEETDSILSFSVDNATVSGQETGSLTIVDSVMDDLTNVEFFTINVSGSGILAGSGSSGNSPLTFAVIPAKPQNMKDKYWGAAGAGSHDTTGNAYGSTGISVPSIGGNRRLYEGTLSEGLERYKSGDAGGTNVTNIMMAKDSATGPKNYSMSFAPFNAVNTGNYGSNNRLFDFGDSGSLIVRINGDRVVEYSLQDNFKTDQKHIAQDLSTYAGEGTASFAAVDANALQYVDLGRLIVTRVEPFNSVSQSIFNAGRLFPNGYQGWSAHIEIDDKLKDGYNKLEFSHSFDDGTSQNWQPFDWYYDDGIELPQFRSTATASLTSTGANTFALSGVDFIEPDTTFTVTFKDAISNLAAQTYRRQDGQIMETAEDPSSANLTISSDGDTDGVLNHKLSSTSVNKGLHFGTDVDDIVPTKFESGSLTISVRASNLSNALTGDERFIEIHQFHRQFDGVNNFLEQFSSTGFTDQISVGRFVTEPTTNSTTTIENFFNETFRYKAASNGGILTDVDGNAIPPRMEDFRNSSAYLGSYWINSANTDFVSSENIIDEPELQVHHDGALRYPKETYPSVLPSVVDYSSATGDRFYYRAFDIGSGTTAVTALKITVGFDSSNPLLLDDFITAPVSANGFNPASTNFDGAPIRIDICLPGPVAGAGINNDITAPGTKWGVATANGSGGNPSASPFADDWVTSTIFGTRYAVVAAGTDNFSTFAFSETVTTSDSEHVILMGMNAIDTQFTNGIVLCRVRFKSTATETRHQITSLKIEPVS